MKTRTELVIEQASYTEVRLAKYGAGDAICIKQGSDNVVLGFEEITEFCRQLGEWAAINGYYAPPPKPAAK